MEPILFLVHRIPFPPNKGDKIRSHHLLRHLAQRYRVHLGTFIDDPADAKYVSELDKLCASQCVVTLDPRRAKMRSLIGFVTGEALTRPYYRSARLRRWVRQTCAEHDIQKAVVFSSAMAQYVENMPQLHVVLDLVDVDSAKWTQYAERHAWPASYVYRREGIKLLIAERRAAAQAAATVLITRHEAQLFAKLAPEIDDVQVVENGVDTEHFTPRMDHASPFAADEAPIVFTGAMDYWPNIDAVTWYVQHVLPDIVRSKPQARFYIVGMNPAQEVRELAVDARVVVTGAVPDMRPYLQHATAIVAPLRIARGIQNKVLEAMAMEKPVVVSAAAASALAAVPGVHIETATDAAEFARKTLLVMQPDLGPSMGERARAQIVSHYCWQRNLSAFDRLLHRNASSVDVVRAATAH